jgi:pyruvate kinase
MPHKLQRTKIVCTIGPASESPEIMASFIDAGMNVARMNFSHGSHEDHQRRISDLRNTARQKNANIAILQDLQGPKIRTGKMKDGGMTLTAKQKVILRFGTEQAASEIPIDYANLAQDVEVGARILLDDGLLTMRVTEKQGTDVHAEVVYGGFLKSRKGVNFPDSKLSIPATTEKDLKDLFFGISQNVDYVALSFVQTAKDIDELKETIRSYGGNTPIVAKIEMKLAIDNLDAICETADAIMVARGDLGVECGFANVSSYQKHIIATARKYGKPVIVATQMLESMQENHAPTKAEVLDVANAVLDGADATMLSGESASGKFPLIAVQTMRDITARADTHSLHNHQQSIRECGDSIREVTARAAAELAVSSKAKAIVCLSMSGETARIIASYRPHVPVFALSPRPEVVRRLALVSGVHPILNTNLYASDKALINTADALVSRQLLKKGDTIVITAGTPLAAMRTTNLVKLHHISLED